MFKKRTTTDDVAAKCRKLAAETTDPEKREQYELGAELAEQGLVPPHIKGSAYASKGIFRR